MRRKKGGNRTEGVSVCQSGLRRWILFPGGAPLARAVRLLIVVVPAGLLLTYLTKYVYLNLPPTADIKRQALSIGLVDGTPKSNLLSDTLVSGQGLRISRNSLEVFIRFCIDGEWSGRFYLDCTSLEEIQPTGTWCLACVGRYSEGEWNGLLMIDMCRKGAKYEITVCQNGKRLAVKKDNLLPAPSSLEGRAPRYILQVYSAKTRVEATVRKEIAEEEYGVTCDVFEVIFPEKTGVETSSRKDPYGKWFRVCVAERFASLKAAEDFYRSTFGAKKTFPYFLIHPVFSEFPESPPVSKGGARDGKPGDDASDRILSGSAERPHSGLGEHD